MVVLCRQNRHNFITCIYHLGLSPAFLSPAFITWFITCVYHLVYQNQYAACTLYIHRKSSDFHTPYTLVVYGPCIKPIWSTGNYDMTALPKTLICFGNAMLSLCLNHQTPFSLVSKYNGRPYVWVVKHPSVGLIACGLLAEATRAGFPILSSFFLPACATTSPLKQINTKTDSSRVPQNRNQTIKNINILSLGSLWGTWDVTIG